MFIPQPLKREKLTANELREYLESLPCPFCTDGFNDETLNKISNDLELEMNEWYEWEKEGSVSSTDVEEHELETLENLCIKAGIPYYEDLER